MLQIDQELSSLFPPQAPWEIALLRESLISEGCREPIYHCQFGIIDGMTRFRICTELGIAYDNRELDFDTKEAAIEWMVRWQIGRRSLTKSQAKYLWGKATGTKRLPGVIEKASGLSTRSLIRAKDFADNVDQLDPDVRHEVLESGATEAEVKELAQSGVDEQREFLRKKKAKKQAAKDSRSGRSRTRQRSKRETDLFPHLKGVADEPFWDEAIAAIESVVSRLGSVANSPSGAFFTKLEMVTNYLERTIEAFENSRFHCVCEKCGGRGTIQDKPCQYCRQQGWLTKWRAEEISAFESDDE